ncbi:MAG: DUF2490 domain-containing protein [Sphingomonadaceae bacterium]
MRVAPAVPAALAVLVAMAAPARAVEHDGQAWTNFMAYGTVTSDLALWFDVSLRWTDDFSRLGQALFRPGIGWKPNRNFMAIAGYVFSEVNPVDGPTLNEHRLFQQLDVTLHRWDTGVISTRARFEQRFFEGATQVQIRHRQKLYVRQEIPGTGGIEALGSYETFLILREADVGLGTGVEQGRAFVGAGIPLTKTVTLETGYQNQHVFRRDETFMSHGLWVMFAVRY